MNKLYVRDNKLFLIKGKYILNLRFFYNKIVYGNF